VEGVAIGTGRNPTGMRVAVLGMVAEKEMMAEIEGARAIV
jgi:hypothetical protein